MNFNVFPNPNDGKFIIENLHNELYDVVIHNVFGQQVYHDNNIKDLKNEINLSQFSSGIYILKISDKISAFTQKLVVE